MIGTDYTPGLLAELAKKPNVRSLEIPVPPKGQRIASSMRRYTDDWVCKTTEYDEDSTRFGSILDQEVKKVTVSSQPAGLCVSFVVSQWFEEGLDKISIVLSPAASVEVKSEIGAVSVIEETDEPWLAIVEPC